ncbi:MAG: hypothetical protein LBS27_04900 [Bifidobacteriaceae bacterium]|jgi:general stress protein 26|nr:hypothetical protein [Bifidobacteriaceae bacterium]
MSRYDEGIARIEATCGNGKDNVIALATIVTGPGNDGQVRPAVRDVDAMYEAGVFYVTTTANSNKALQIASNPEVAFAVAFEGVYGHGSAENLGWVLDPKNATLRDKLRQTFADWYDAANNEQDPNCVILAIRVTTCSIFQDHGAVRYELDLVAKTEAGDSPAAA